MSYRSVQRKIISTSSNLAAEDARNSAKAFGFNNFESWLTTGGDDRSLIHKSTGTNKYYTTPKPINSTHIFRGSCTCNPPTSRGYNAARKLYEDRIEGFQGVELNDVLREIFASQRDRLAAVMNLPRGCEIIICPSGTDAEYIPIAIAKMLSPKDAQIRNGITQLQEIGAGSAKAAMGEYFSSHSPLTGELPHGLTKLHGFEGIQSSAIPARTKNGEVIDAVEGMKEFMNETIANGHYPIVHGVFGGKTGIRDEVMPPSLEGGRESLGVVDACQGRFTSAELIEWLEQDSLVLFSASKFFQAPPFCGAVIVPCTIADQLFHSNITPKEMLTSNGLGAYLTDKELPPCLNSWKNHLRDEGKNNIGLALRWEAGLIALEQLASVSDEKRITNINAWSAAVTQMVNNESQLEAWCSIHSIISIRVSNNNDGWLNMEDCRHLFRLMSVDVSSAVPDATEEEKVALSTIAYIGQPVSVCEDHAIVRMALGVESLIAYIDSKDATLMEDRMIVKKLALISKHFCSLKGISL